MAGRASNPKIALEMLCLFYTHAVGHHENPESLCFLIGELKTLMFIVVVNLFGLICRHFSFSS